MENTARKEASANDPAVGLVLVAVDFSSDSEAAFLWACHHAKMAGAPLRVVHVVHDPAEAPGYYRRSEADVLVPMQEVANEMMAEFMEKMRGEHAIVNEIEDLETMQVTGLPATRIIEVAKHCKAALIVVGCQGRTGLDRLLIGSKAERVVRLSPIPVVVIKSGQS